MIPSSLLITSGEFKTHPLHAEHIRLGAKMAPFAGYDMPISYDPTTGGMRAEHMAVRSKLGIFDVSHMGEFFLEGPQALDFLHHVATRDYSKLKDGRAQYALLLNSGGTIIDDIIVYKFHSEKFLIVVNAANLEKDFAHLKKEAASFKVDLTNKSDQIALIAVQGPDALKLAEKFFPEALQLPYYGFLQKGRWIIARTGYTGEDGFEVFLPPEDSVKFWKDCLDFGAVPIGLGARDTLRLEVGFALYGHELSDQLIPTETISSFAVRSSHKFIGSEHLQKPQRFRPVAVLATNPKPFREGENLMKDGRVVGKITSGSFSPILKLGMGLALIESTLNAKEGDVFLLESSGKPREARLVLPPFVETARVKKSRRIEVMAEAGFNVPQDVLYTKNHEWARIEDGIAVIGITDFAQSQLGDITYVELPEEGENVTKEKVFGSVDSLKTVAELYAPLGGTIEEVNTELPNNAEKVNEDPYGDGWMIKVEIANEAELEELLPAAEYLKLISKLAKKK